MSRPARPTALVVGTQTVAVVVLTVAVGVLAGVVWHALWDAPTGTVSDGQWFTGEPGLRAEFSGTAWYLLVGVVAGLVVGVLSGLLLARWELWTLVVLVAASALAGWVMWRVGLHLGPPDPQVLARGAADGTRLPGRLSVAGRSPFVALPLGAVVAYTAVLLTTSHRGRRAPTPDDRSDAGPQPGVEAVTTDLRPG